MHAAELAMLEVVLVVNCGNAVLLLMLRGTAAAAVLKQHERAPWRLSEWNGS